MNPLAPRTSLAAQSRAKDVLNSQPTGLQQLAMRAKAAQQANRTAHLRRVKQLEELKREVMPKIVGVKTSWAKGQGPPTPKV